MESKDKKASFVKFFEDFGLLALSVSLFLGGVFLLSLQIPFWSLVLGLASVQIGIVLIIITFDSLIRKRNKPLTEDYKTLSCLICRTPQFVPKYQKSVICDTCQLRVANVFKATLVLVFAVISVSVVTLLVTENQELRKKAAELESGYNCLTGTWSPTSCECGIWREIATCGGDKGRLCRDGEDYCCTQDENTDWKCYTNSVDK